ncbi:YihY family inner membrane protein [Xylophilus sp. ASV27]|uniref:YihY family inner membrane protein n=1 Tax=Xylophilus sp. ASV27 TaxID=2795129 RepID=UPI0018EB8DC5|nr:YihY family inner membrane protein [Xylophilus sp. ASV27]
MSEPPPLQRRSRIHALRARVRTLLRGLSRFPWRVTALTLRERFREDQLALTAGSLTFTTVLALVPFFTVALAVFTAFPMFSQVQEQLQRWLIASLVPEGIARQVLGYLTQFASKASRLGVAGLSFLLVTALALILTIDQRLNAIWRVRRPRPLGQRVLIYWAAITLGPLVLGVSLSITSFAVSQSRGVVEGLPGGLQLLLGSLEFLLLAAGMAALYHYVPNTRVKWGHAWIGGLFVAFCIEGGKKLLGLYVAAVPTYSVLYGAFAALPILLVWMYMAWVIVLLGAVIAAYLPSLLAGVARRAGAHGWQFQLAIEVLQQLREAQQAGIAGRTTLELAQALRIDALQLRPVLDTLSALDWTGQLREQADDAPSRNVLLADPARTPLAPLVHRLLLPRAPTLEPLWENARLERLMLAEVL